MPLSGPFSARPFALCRRCLIVPALATFWLGAGTALGGPGDAPPAASEAPSAPPATTADVVAPSRPEVAEVARQVDVLLREALRQRDAAPAEACSDEAFLRRASLDLLGVVPTVAEVRAFRADVRPEKRAALVDALLARPEAGGAFAEWFARLLLGRANVDPRRRAQFEGYLASAWRDRLPYHALVASLVTAKGALDEHPEAVYAAQFAPDTAALAGRTARLFLGVRIACAQCHDHPFDKWKQVDFGGLAAYFARTRIEKIATPVDMANNVNGRAEQQARQGVALLDKAKTDLAAAEEALTKAEAARKAAAAAYEPVLAAVAKAQEAALKAREPAASLAQVATQAEALAQEAKQHAEQKDLPEALRSAAREQVRTAEQAAEQARIAAREADAAAQAYEGRAARALAEGAAAKTALDQAVGAAAKAAGRRDALKAIVDGAPDLLARHERLRDLTRRLAAAVPDVYRSRYLAASRPVPAERFRLIDVPGQVNPRPRNPAKPGEGDGMPRTLDGTPVAAGFDAVHLREELASWMASRKNPYFARAAVNRFAAQLWGRGLVETVDDVGDGSLAFSPEALELLAQDFADAGFDVRRLLAVLVLSLPYQEAAQGGQGRSDVPFVTSPVRELQPEVLLRSLTRALLGERSEGEDAGLGAGNDALRGALSLFDDGEDRPALTPRSGVRAALWLQNGGPLATALSGRKDGRAARLVAAGADDSAALDEVFLAFLARTPSEAERAAVLAVLPPRAPQGDAKAQAAADAARVRALEDLMWALANSTEFLTSH